MHSQKEGEGSSLLKWAIAGAIATGLGLLFTTQKGEEIREDVAEKGKQAAKKFTKTRKELQAIIQDTFGEISDELEEAYVELQSELLASLEDHPKMTKEKYEDMVDKMVDQFSKKRDWTLEAIKNLKKNLRQDWQDLKEKLADAE